MLEKLELIWITINGKMNKFNRKRIFIGFLGVGE